MTVIRKLNLKTRPQRRIGIRNYASFGEMPRRLRFLFMVGA